MHIYVCTFASWEIKIRKKDSFVDFFASFFILWLLICMYTVKKGITSFVFFSHPCSQTLILSKTASHNDIINVKWIYLTKDFLAKSTLNPFGQKGKAGIKTWQNRKGELELDCQYIYEKALFN